LSISWPSWLFFDTKTGHYGTPVPGFVI
jgi:hypothetical protein